MHPCLQVPGELPRVAGAGTVLQAEALKVFIASIGWGGVWGLEADAACWVRRAGILRSASPRCPCVRELTIDDLAVGSARFSLQFTRDENVTTARVLSISGGEIEVAVESGN